MGTYCDVSLIGRYTPTQQHDVCKDRNMICGAYPCYEGKICDGLYAGLIVSNSSPVCVYYTMCTLGLSALRTEE